tara:strand:- start:577 stop:831 length:255 start_codon:yes stop_codon:yes gene_type:complete
MASIRRTFSIPDEISTEFDNIIPSRERSKFIALTLREALQEKKREELLALLKKLPMKEIPQGVQSEDILRKMRDEHAQQIISNS